MDNVNQHGSKLLVDNVNQHSSKLLPWQHVDIFTTRLTQTTSEWQREYRNGQEGYAATKVSFLKGEVASRLCYLALPIAAIADIICNVAVAAFTLLATPFEALYFWKTGSQEERKFTVGGAFANLQTIVELAGVGTIGTSAGLLNPEDAVKITRANDQFRLNSLKLELDRVLAGNVELKSANNRHVTANEDLAKNLNENADFLQNQISILKKRAETHLQNEEKNLKAASSEIETLNSQVSDLKKKLSESVRVNEELQASAEKPAPTVTEVPVPAPTEADEPAVAPTGTNEPADEPAVAPTGTNEPAPTADETREVPKPVQELEPQKKSSTSSENEDSDSDALDIKKTEGAAPNNVDLPEGDRA